MDGVGVDEQVVQVDDTAVPETQPTETPTPDYATADDVTSIVNDAIDSAVARVGETVAQGDTQVVEQLRGDILASSDNTLSDQSCEIVQAQWDYMSNELRLQSTLSLFTLLLLAVVAGVSLCGYFVKGWRK